MWCNLRVDKCGCQCMCDTHLQRLVLALESVTQVCHGSKLVLRRRRALARGVTGRLQLRHARSELRAAVLHLLDTPTVVTLMHINDTGVRGSAAVSWCVVLRWRRGCGHNHAP